MLPESQTLTSYGIISLNCTGAVTWITPAQMQFSVHVLSSEGWRPLRTVAAPGTHGVMVMGRHGCGVSTPDAAEVAAATMGLSRLMHRPNGVIMTMGWWSMIVATDWLLVITRLAGKTVSGLGAMPKLHASSAP